MSLENWTLLTGNEDVNEPYGSNNYKILVDGTGEENIGEEMSEVPIVYFVDWDSRTAFLDDLLGYATNWGPGEGISRVLPEEHPQYVGFYATSASVMPKGAPSLSTGVSRFKKAAIKAIFRPVKYAVLADSDVTTELERFVERDYDDCADNVTLQGVMKFVSASPERILNASPVKVQPSRLITYKWHRVPALFGDPFKPPTDSAITECIGRINSEPFDGYEAGTLLFLKPKCTMSTPRLATADNYSWTIEYQMLRRDFGEGLMGERAGHNYVFDVVSGEYDLVTNDGTFEGVRTYNETADFNDLFIV